MKKLVLVGSLVTVGSAFAISGLEVDVSAGVISHKPSGVIQYPVPGGDVIDIKKDLGLGEESKVFGRVKFEHFLPLLPNLYLQYMPMEFTGSGNISKSIKYGQTTYTANTKVDSKVQLDRFDLGLYYGIPLSGLATMGTLDPEIGINVRIMDFKGSITGSSGSQIKTESKSATIPIPMLYGALGVNPFVIPVSFRGEIRGVSVSKVTYYDWTLEGRVKPLKLIPLYLSAGYRYEKLKIDDISDIYTDLTVKGPFFMVGASF
ncbi:MAG: TIGR04219 family outer membrane beta-barrel protein [Hydrogenothermaceae bacterium]|nr:TIGR04219 family outer membrane beta-barrel protein [Hydrogenothermaceae bacterium]